MRRFFTLLLLAATGLLGMLPSAHASCVALLAAGTCSATVSATGLSFGNYDPNGGALNVTSTVSVTPTVAGAVGLLVTMGYDISLSAGANSTIADRKLNGPNGSQLSYNLYSDPLRAVVWGDSGVSDVYAIVLNLLGSLSTTRNYTVYGRIPAGQYVTPGAYQNTINVTVNF